MCLRRTGVLGCTEIMCSYKCLRQPRSLVAGLHSQFSNLASNEHANGCLCKELGKKLYLLPHLGWIAARAPNRVNRAHGPTKENRQKFCIFSIFPAHAENGPRWPQMGPGRFFPTNPDLADILGRTDFDFENFYFLDFFGSQISGLGPLGPHVGPLTLGPTWAHPLGPHRLIATITFSLLQS